MPLNGTFKDLLIRGLIAGLIAGVLAGIVAYLLGETYIDQAIGIEEAKAALEEAAAHSHGDAEEALFTRPEQKGGLILATSLTGLALGAIFACAINAFRKVSKLTAGALTIGTTLVAWLAIEVVPFFKYPANPPAVGDQETINTRTLLWLASVTLGLAAVIAAGYVVSKLIEHPLGVRVGAAVATFAAIVAVGYLTLPTVNEVPDDFPAALLWNFRVASLTTQLTLWLTLGIAFALITEYSRRERKVAVLTS